MNDITKNSVIYFLHRSTFFLIIFPLIVSYKSNSLFLVILSLLFTYLLIKLVNYFKKYKLTKYIIFVIIIFFIFYMFMLLVDFTNYVYLKETKDIYIYLLFIVTTIYISFKKVDTITKASFILFIISIFMFIIQSNQLFISLDYSNNLVNSNINIFDLLVDSFKISFISLIPFLIVEDTKKIRNFYLISSFTILITSIFTLNIIDNNLLVLYEYPIVKLLSYINIFGFINRLESLFSLMWITDIIICLSLCINYIKSKVHIIHNHHK